MSKCDLTSQQFFLEFFRSQLLFELIMETKLKRSRIQFGILALLITMAVFAVLMSILIRPSGPLPSLSYEDYNDASTRAIYRETWLGKDYDKWEKYHQSIVKILKSHGSVSMATQPKPDFYHTGDWFDTFTDGFAFGNAKILSVKLLQELTDCVTASDPGATLEFVGIEGDVDGLQVLITEEGAFAHWNGKTVAACEERLSELGF